MAKQNNTSFIIIIGLLCIIIFYLLQKQNLTVNDKLVHNKLLNEKLVTVYDSRDPRLIENPSPNFNVQLVQDSKDTVRNPYAPPIRYYEEGEYKQLGYLSNNRRKIILFGKAAHYRRDKWYYYTIIDNIKYPIEINKRKCSVQPGCDSVSSKDIVQVDGENYTVTMYEFDL
jgi:hypothetical protein